MLSRLIIPVGGAALFLLVNALPAFADPWGSVDCSQSPTPACELGAGKGGARRYGEGANPRPGLGAQSGHSGGADKGDHIVGDSAAVHCFYIRSDYRPPAIGVAVIAYQPRGHDRKIAARPAVFSPELTNSARQIADPAAGQPGAWYMYKCDQAGVIDALYRAPVWIPDAQPGAPPSPAQLAEQARSQLLLPSPRIKANPVGEQLVNLPTWLWLDSASWGARSATAQIPGVSVTAVARPTWVSWSMGDGTSVTCSGQGSPFPAGGDAGAASPDCGHTYRISSARQNSQVFPVTATVYWSVTWWGAGQGGTFTDLTTSTSTQFRVAEAQALGAGMR
jgi:hypothetical protein